MDITSVIVIAVAVIFMGGIGGLIIYSNAKPRSDADNKQEPDSNK
jgi:hypothetical protein